VKIDKGLFRPVDIYDIFGDNTEAKKLLDWSYELDFFSVLDMLIVEEQKTPSYA
jgi:GDPmannose 4,6-dehydratase